MQELVGLDDEVKEEEDIALSPWAAAELQWVKPSMDRVIQIQSEFWPQLKQESAK